ncbi:SDR family oxidoreductase [Sphingomonas oligoaromativorans]
MIPACWVGQPEEVGGTMLVLACDDASFINGVEFLVDGSATQI